ncbi:arsenical pump family protein [Thiolapillus brandeum]|uniref:Arsenical pump family protein n=1 Tax=Thiolapillus brandeum TaxID=1076588 RepID=A0A7U6JHU8_9GAMM|nr:arsenical pump family protein [Thiolapillus brandeum]
MGVFAIGSLLLASMFGLVPFGDIIIPGGQRLHMPVYIEAVDWEVIAIIIGSSLFVDVTSRSGLFSWIAIRLTKASSGDPLKLLWYYGGMTVLFSAVLNNVTAMIIVGSLTGVSLKKLGQDRMLLGFLLIEGLLTNVGGLLTLISSVPNIIVGNAAGISFVSFFLKASPYVLVATIATLLMGARLFGIRALRTDFEKQQAAELIRGFDERDGIHSQGFFWFSSAALVAFILAIATTSITPVISDLGMGFVAMAFAVVVLARFKHEVEEFYDSIDWDLILFFMSLFVVINVMEHARVLELIGSGVAWMIGSGESSLGTAALLLASSVFSSVTDNIPLAAMLAKILVGLGIDGDSSLWWAVVFGANLGGNITPIGSASTLVAVTIIHKYHLKLSFGGFIRIALPFAIMQIVLATGYVLAIL